MRAEPWGLVRTDHGSSTIRCTPTYNRTATHFMDNSFVNLGEEVILTLL